MRIDGKIASQLNTTQLNTPSGSPQIKPLGEQIAQTLFGRARPPLLDAANFPDLAALLRILNRYRRKLALLAGDQDNDYALVLADDTIAAIDENGTIYVGAAFLMAHARNLEVPVGVLAHEIGHRPKRWREEKYLQPRALTQPEREALCRHEETRADIFAGKGLAELGMACEPLAQFLESIGGCPHPEYLPAEVRANVIREAHAARAYRTANRRKIFPDMARHTSADGYIGEF
jgi:hypothetical protein